MNVKKQIVQIKCKINADNEMKPNNMALEPTIVG